MKKMNINFQNSTIELSKAKAKAASIFDSDAYKELIEVRTQFPNFKVVIKETAKSNGRMKGFNYDFMENYIRTHSDSEARIAEYEKLKNSGISYFDIKKWFLNTYPIFKDTSKSKADCILAA